MARGSGSRNGLPLRAVRWEEPGPSGNDSGGLRRLVEADGSVGYGAEESLCSSSGAEETGAGNRGPRRVGVERGAEQAGRLFYVTFGAIG